jgi:hypothetical protein
VVNSADASSGGGVVMLNGRVDSASNDAFLSRSEVAAHLEPKVSAIYERIGIGPIDLVPP